MWPVMNRIEYRLNPYAELNRLQRRMNQVFESSLSSAAEFPPVNVAGTADEVVVSAELPGVDPAQLDVSVEGRVLTLSGKHTGEPRDESWTVYRQERPSGSFMRTVRLPFDVDPDRIAARYEHGILRITLPRSEATKPRKIEIAS